MPGFARRAWMGWVPLVLAGMTSACAARLYEPPSGPGAPFDEAAAAWTTVTAPCRFANRFVAEVSVDGWSGASRQRFSATFHTALTSQNDLYLEVPAPGRSFVQMVGRANEAVLLLPRDERVLRAPTRDIVDALTGLRWDAGDLLRVLSGCVVQPSDKVTGQIFGDRAALELGGDARAWIRRRDGQWQLEAAARDGLLIEYRAREGAFPSNIRVSATAPGVTPLQLTFAVKQVQVNIDLAPGTFVLAVPQNFVPMTLDDLRATRPLDKGKGPQ